MSQDPLHRREPAPRREISDAEALARSTRFLHDMVLRRSIRDFSTEAVDRRLIENAIAVANSAPSGANIQPWRFVVITDPATKRRIREGAEAEEKEFYASRASMQWLEALAPLGTGWSKPHLEAAPYLIVVFEVHESDAAPRPYYVKESVGLAVGFLLAALHESGLATLTHTPSPMRFLNEILSRPSNERPFVVIPVGKMAAEATVPVLNKKPPHEVTSWVEPDPRATS